MEYNNDIGTITLYPGKDIPLGWRLCDGSQIHKGSIPEGDYTALAAALNQKDTAASLKLPDLTDRFPVGAGTDAALGKTGGPDHHMHTIEFASFSMRTHGADARWTDHVHLFPDFYTIYGYDDGGDVNALADKNADSGMYHDHIKNPDKVLRTGPPNPLQHEHSFDGKFKSKASELNTDLMRPLFWAVNFIIRVSN